MKTVTIQIGNTDNKLTQQEWARFVDDVKYHITCLYKNVHFFGGSSTWDSWQNVTWVIEIEEGNISELKDKLKSVREQFKQDSVAWTEGVSEFI